MKKFTVHSFRSRRLFAAGLLLFSFFFIHQSCTKIDTVGAGRTMTDAEITQKFFTLPPGTGAAAGRAADYLKQQNSISSFVPGMAAAQGYPVWNKTKMAVHARTASFANATAADGDTTLIIPLVPENDNKISGFLEVFMRGDITAYLYKAGSYKDYPFTQNAPDTVMTAQKYALLMMYVNKQVFGTSSFIITDPALNIALHPGSSRGNEIHLPDAAGAGNNLMGTDLCYVIQGPSESCTCGAGQLCDWNDFENYGAFGCPACAMAICITYNDYPGGSGPGDGPGTGTGDGDGGPTGGGGSCRQIGVANPLPPCGSGGPGGWNPIPPVVVPPHANPCQVVDSLFTYSNLPNYYHYLKDSINAGREKSLAVVNPFSLDVIAYPADGPVGKLGIDLTLASPVDHYIHTHYKDPKALSVFSKDDLENMFYWFNHNKMKDKKSFTMGVITDSTSYIIMIEDPIKFRSFGNSFIASDQLDDFFYSAYHIHEDSSVISNEKHFLQALQSSDAGLKVFKGNRFLTGFSPIKLLNNEVVPAPCN